MQAAGCINVKQQLVWVSVLHNRTIQKQDNCHTYSNQVVLLLPCIQPSNPENEGGGASKRLQYYFVEISITDVVLKRLKKDEQWYVSEHYKCNSFGLSKYCFVNFLNMKAWLLKKTAR